MTTPHTGPARETMLITIATFIDPPRAELARGLLEGEGIEATVQDRYVVGVNWLYSVAVRGVKLQVREADLERAVTILSEDHTDLLAEETSGVPGSCESCGSTRLSAYDPIRALAALTLFPFWPLALLIGIPLIRWDASWRCLSCKRRW